MIYKFYAMLNSSTLYSSIDSSLRYHINLSPEVQRKSAFVTPTGNFIFKKEPAGLSQAPTHFQKLINEVLKCLPFAF